MGWRDKVKPKRTIDPPGPYGYTSSDTNTKSVSLEEMDKVMEDFARYVNASRVELPSPDILVMTEEHWKLLREESSSVNSPSLGSPLDLLGIPVEVYPTYEECRARAFLLLDEGKRVGFVSLLV